MNRADRRRRLKEDERLVARGLAVPKPSLAQLMALMRVLYDRVELSRETGSIAPLIACLHFSLAASARAVRPVRLACRQGCAHCCHAWVSARAPEILHLKASLPAGRQAAVTEAVARALAVTEGLGPDARARLPTPCPLLEDNLCSVYADRPAACRTAVSEDAARCERVLMHGSEEGIPAPETFRTLRNACGIALAGALKQAGLSPVCYELNSGLAAVLARPDAEAAWLAGEDVFAGALRDPLGDPFDHPRNRRFYDAVWAG